MARTEALPSDAWRACVANESLPFGQVQSPQQVAAWHSPSAQNLMVPVGDLALLRHCEATGDYGQLRTAWAGSLFEATHRLVIQMPTSPPTYFLCMGHLSDSCVIALPCEIHSLSGVDSKFFQVAAGITRPTLLPITDLDSIKAFSYRFVSYMSLRASAPARHRSSLKPALYMQVAQGPAHPLEIACRCAWWAMGRTAIARFAALRKVEIPSGAGLFDTLYATTMQILSISEGDALAIVGIRIAAERNAMQFSEELLEMDAAIEIIDSRDRDEVQQERKAATNKKQDIDTFSKAFRAKREQVRTLCAKKAKPGNRGRGGGSSSSSASRPAVLPKTITQAEAKQFLPAGCAVWRSNTRNEWWGHCKPFKRVVVPWVLGEESSAMFIVLKRLWQQHLEKTGEGPEACPFEGLL